MELVNEIVARYWIEAGGEIMTWVYWVNSSAVVPQRGKILFCDGIDTIEQCALRDLVYSIFPLFAWDEWCADKG